MSETWADAQFDLLEEAYNEIPIEAKARIEQLETLVRDMWFKNIGRMDSCGWCVIGCDDAERCELHERMAALGLLDKQKVGGDE